MTRHERLARIFRGEPVDRPAIKLWSVFRGQPLMHPDYKPVYELALATTDLFDGGAAPFDCAFGVGSPERAISRRRVDGDWDDVTSSFRAGDRTLTQVFRESRHRKPGYTMEHFVKDERDLEAILALPYAPYPADVAPYEAAEARVGEDGIAVYNLPHPAYSLQRLLGSETLAFMLAERRDLVDRAVELFSERLIRHVRDLLDAGIARRGFLAFGWVGPELFIPPLISPRDFDRYCSAPDKRLIDLIKGAGGHIWIHCHGKVRDFIGRFADMGCDMLNPVEPPPMGDVSLREAFGIAGGRMALEGNLQIGDVMTASPERLRFLIDRAAEEAGERFVLGLTTSYMEVPEPDRRLIDNLLLYLRYGLERLESRR